MLLRGFLLVYLTIWKGKDKNRDCKLLDTLKVSYKMINIIETKQ